MVRPTAAGLAVPLSRAKDVTPLASLLHVLGTRSGLETLQALMSGPRLTADLPSRIDELQMLEDIGVVISERLGEGRFTYRWTLRPGALECIAKRLTPDTASGEGA